MEHSRGLAHSHALLRALRSPQDRDAVLAALLQATSQATGAFLAYLGEGSESGWIRTALIDGSLQRCREKKLTGLSRRIVVSGQALLESKIRRGSLFRARPDGWDGVRVDGYAAVKLPRSAPGTSWLAVLRTEADPPFRAETLQFLDLSAEAAATALRQEIEWRKLESLAMTDALTLIPNYRCLRQMIQREVETALRRDEFFTVVMVDVDNLKLYNSAHGHLAGSDILRDVARVLEDSIRTTDFAAKYGGDEFLLVLPRTRPSGGAALSERIRRRIAEGVRGRGGEVLSCSFGVAGFPEDGLDFESLVCSADRALFQAKKNGRNAVVCMSSQEVRRLREAA